MWAEFYEFSHKESKVVMLAIYGLMFLVGWGIIELVRWLI